MAEPNDWLPPLCHIRDHDGDWTEYLKAVYAIFKRDFVASFPRFEGLPVYCRRDPISDGKEAGFWHCISDGPHEPGRLPDFERCERIGWVRAIVENPTDPRVDSWDVMRGTDCRVLLWFQEEYLVVLAERRDSFQFITAYRTTHEHRKRKLRAERDAWYAAREKGQEKS